MTPTIAVDFDNTLCSSKYPDTGPMKPNADWALRVFKTLGFRIIIYSCRTCHWHYDIFGGSPEEPTMDRAHVKAMVTWLEEHNIPYDEIDDGSKGKPMADYYIDDKGVRFDNNWDQVVAFVMGRMVAN